MLYSCEADISSFQQVLLDRTSVVYALNSANLDAPLCMVLMFSQGSTLSDPFANCKAVISYSYHNIPKPSQMSFRILGSELQLGLAALAPLAALAAAPGL